MRLWLSAAAIAILAAVAGAALLSSAGAIADSWTAAVTVPACGSASQPKVVFPFSGPSASSGEGAILWLAAGRGCGASDGAATIDLATIAGSDLPGAPRRLLTGPAAATGFTAPLYALGTSEGEIITVAGASGTNVLGGPEAVAADGFAAGSVDTLRPLGGSDSLVATMNGFIGDADVATITGDGSGSEIVVRAQRHYARSFSGRRYIRLGPGAVTALALGMDYRADRLVVWAQDGSVWARYITNDGRIGERQLLGPSGYDAQISAVLSDDHRAFVIWTDEPKPGVSGTAQVLLAHSGFGPRFHGTQTLASFPEPAGLRLTAGSVGAERLSDEGVVLLWPAMSDGNLEVEAAGATTSGVEPPSTLSVPNQDVRLGAVATGPANEIVVLLEVAPRGAVGFDQSRQELLATRSNVVRAPTGLGFGPLVELAAAGPNDDPSVSVDPATDTAVAAWQTSASGTDQLAYSVGAGNSTAG
jgi:hypothetical protein